MSVKVFIDKYYHRFNAGVLKQAAQGYVAAIQSETAMMVTLAGAMSTAEIGMTLAAMIRNDAVHAISCTGANLEEDVFMAVAAPSYKAVAYRDLAAQDEQALHDAGYNRVTDTCIPESEAMRFIERPLIQAWHKATQAGESRLPHAYIYDLIQDLYANQQFKIPAEHSWVLAAAQKNLPLYVPGWEDSTLGNFCVAAAVRGDASLDCVKSALYYMQDLLSWYTKTSQTRPIGFCQLGGGIAGDFPICAVPLLNQDLHRSVPLWSYFCQITDATESYGGYSGAHPNEKITWGKLGVDTPKFVINSDASIVAPLLFQYVRECL